MASQALPIEPLPRPPPKRRYAFVLIALLPLLACGIKFIQYRLTPREFHASGEILAVQLQGGVLQVPFYCQSDEPKGIVILGTGDGGWSYWEENTAQHLAHAGFAVGGWDCRKFSDSRKYDQKQLATGFRAAVAAVRQRCDTPENDPVWYGGWSTGAEQAVAAAAEKDRPKHLAGLLLAAPGERGRYGITTGDLLGKTPTGPGTFALAEMGARLQRLPVAQFAAGLDPLDDIVWLDHYDGPKRIIHLPGMLHDMGGAGPEFQSKLDEAIAWTLHPES